MPVTTIPQISDVLDQHSVRITTAQTTADFAETEATRALTSIYDVDLGAKVYTDTEIQKLKNELRTEFTNADSALSIVLDGSVNDRLGDALPGLLNSYYGNYAGMQALYDQLLIRFGQSDAALDHLLNNVVPGLAQNVDNASLTATTVAQDFSALEQSLQSVLIVYAADASGNDQSLTADGREYVRYVEYNGNPPALPVSGTFTKFVGTAQSVWPVYASTAGGNDQSFEPGSRTFVTFYESPVAPDLPLIGQTFVRYVGSDGSAGQRGAGVWYVSVTSLPTTSSVAAQNAWVNAVAQGQDIPDVPKIQDQVYFYTGTAGNPTGQRVFICQWVTDVWNHGWDYQENVMRGDLLVPGSVTTNEIDSRGLTILDELGNVILQATGGSAGLNWDRVQGANRPADNADVTGQNTALNIVNQSGFATLPQLNSGNISTYMASAAINTLQLGGNAATAGDFSQDPFQKVGSGLNDGKPAAFTDIRIPPFVTAKILVIFMMEQGYPNYPTVGAWRYMIDYEVIRAGIGTLLSTGIVTERTNGMFAASDTPVIGRVVEIYNGNSFSVDFLCFGTWYGQDSNVVLGKSTMSLFAGWR